MTANRPQSISSFTPLRVVAAFDIGSNSIKMTVARQSSDGAIVELISLAETTRLGAGIEITGLLSEASMHASLEVLRRFAGTARQFGAQTLIGVATEATRVTQNGPAFLDAIRREIGLRIDTISGEREAELTFLGIPPALRDEGVVLAADIGGASTELIAARDGVIEQSASYPIGSGRFTDRFVEHDPPHVAELGAARSAAVRTGGDRDWPDVCDRLLVLGGTGEFTRRLIGHEWPANPSELDAQLERLTTISSVDLAPEIGASEMRARVLPAGIAIAAGLADRCRPDLIYGAASGIRLGLILDAFRERST